MSEVSDYAWQELVDTFPTDGFYEKVVGMARIEGVIDGRRYAVLVPLNAAKDEPLGKAYLRMMADLEARA